MVKPAQRSHYVIVEGAIGVGKTTLVRRLTESLGALSVFEVFEENPFLKDFYSDRKRYAFQTEMFFLLERYRQLESLSQPDLFSPYMIADYLFEKSRLFARETLREDEFALFDQMFHILSRNVPRPDLVFYLTAPVDVLMKRIATRGRPYERSIEPAYLENLGRIYEEHFARQVDVPVVTVDTTHLNFATDDDAVAVVLDLIHRPPQGRIQIPGPVQASLAF